MPRYTPARAVQGEGARIGFITCTECGCSLLLDAADEVSVQEIHNRWHEKITNVGYEATRYKPPPTYGGG
jgi:hypothetical protein